MAKQLRNIVKVLKGNEGDCWKRQIIKSLKELFKLRLSNGNNFLHLTLSCKEPLTTFIINLLSRFNMTFVLNMRNYLMQTILHVAIINELSEVIPFLIKKGCDPMLEDMEGNNAIHYCVMYQTCLDVLLKSIMENKTFYNFDALNFDGRAALHLAVIYRDDLSVGELLKYGANCNVRHKEGSTPLHFAVHNNCFTVAQKLLEYIPPEHIDITDERDCTALQIICNSQIHDNTVNLVKILLQKNADPTLKHGEMKPAWQLVEDKLELREVIYKYLPTDFAFEKNVSSDEETSDEDYEDCSDVDLSTTFGTLSLDGQQ